MLQFVLLICTCSLKELCTNWSEQKYQNKHTTLTVFNYWIFKFGNISDGDQEENSHIFLVFNRSNVEQIPHRCAYNKYTRRLLIRYTAKNVQVATSLLTSCDNLSQQADLRMRSHGLRQLVHDSLFTTACSRQACCKLSTDLLQVDNPNLLSTGLLQVVSTSCNKSAIGKLQQA